MNMRRFFFWPMAAAVVVAALAATTTEAGLIGGKMNMTLEKWGPHGVSGAPTITLYSKNAAGNPATPTYSSALSNGGGFYWKNLSPVAPTTAADLSDLIDPLPDDPTKWSGHTVNKVDLLTFCLELNQNISWGSTYTATFKELKDAPSSGAPPGVNPTGMGEQSANWIGQLWAAFFPTQIQPLVQATTIESNLAGAFQLAIWKLEYDGAMLANILANNDHFEAADFGTGFLRSSSLSHAAVTKAAEWIDYVLQNTDTLPRAQLVALTGNFQDQLTQLDLPNIEQHPVPEPSSVAIWLAIGGVLAFPRLRSRRTEKQAA